MLTGVQPGVLSLGKLLPALVPGGYATHQHKFTLNCCLQYQSTRVIPYCTVKTRVLLSSCMFDSIFVLLGMLPCMLSCSGCSQPRFPRWASEQNCSCPEPYCAHYRKALGVRGIIGPHSLGTQPMACIFIGDDEGSASFTGEELENLGST